MTAALASLMTGAALVRLVAAAALAQRLLAIDVAQHSASHQCPGLAFHLAFECGLRIVSDCGKWLKSHQNIIIGHWC